MASAERVALFGAFGALLLGCAVTGPAAAPLASPAPASLSLAPAPGVQSGLQSVAPASPSPRAPVSSSESASGVSSPAAPPPMTLIKDPLVEKLLGGGSAALKTVVATPEKYRFQVLYGVITEGPKPTLERHGYRADVEYFFPASSMKVPITLATYDRLATLRAAGKAALTRDATMRIHPASGNGETPYTTTLARETWRALIVSDNASANRLLAVVGHREVHETLWSLRLSSARIHAGFATGAEIDPARVSPRIDFTAPGGATAELAPRQSDLVLPRTDATNLDIGRANIVDGRRVEAPLSFADKNAMRLYDLQDTLVRIMRPELLPPASPADTASQDDLAYVRQALGTLPSESGLAGFDRNVVADYTLIPFLRGIERVRARGRFQIFSKVGQAFGFLTANAYVVDKETGRSFFLVASVYANPDETMNDDNYAYDSISFPALADVGEAVARHAFAP